MEATTNSMPETFNGESNEGASNTCGSMRVEDNMEEEGNEMEYEIFEKVDDDNDKSGEAEDDCYLIKRNDVEDSHVQENNAVDNNVMDEAGHIVVDEWQGEDENNVVGEGDGGEGNVVDEGEGEDENNVVDEGDGGDGNVVDEREGDGGEGNNLVDEGEGVDENNVVEEWEGEVVGANNLVDESEGDGEDRNNVVDEVEGADEEGNNVVDEVEGADEEGNNVVDEREGAEEEGNNVVDESEGAEEEGNNVVDESEGEVVGQRDEVEGEGREDEMFGKGGEENNRDGGEVSITSAVLDNLGHKYIAGAKADNEGGVDLGDIFNNEDYQITSICSSIVDRLALEGSDDEEEKIKRDVEWIKDVKSVNIRRTSPRRGDKLNAQELPSTPRWKPCQINLERIPAHLLPPYPPVYNDDEIITVSSLIDEDEEDYDVKDYIFNLDDVARRCSYCKYVSDDDFVLATHEVTHHRAIVMRRLSTTEESTYHQISRRFSIQHVPTGKLFCKLCGLMDFDPRTHLVNHIKKAPHMCEACTFTEESDAALTQHSGIHTNNTAIASLILRAKLVVRPTTSVGKSVVPVTQQTDLSRMSAERTAAKTSKLASKPVIPPSNPSKSAPKSVKLPLKLSKPPPKTSKPPPKTLGPPPKTLRPPPKTLRPPPKTLKPPSKTLKPHPKTVDPPPKSVNPPQMSVKSPPTSVRTTRRSLPLEIEKTKETYVKVAVSSGSAGRTGKTTSVVEQPTGMTRRTRNSGGDLIDWNKILNPRSRKASSSSSSSSLSTTRSLSTRASAASQSHSTRSAHREGVKRVSEEDGGGKAEVSAVKESVPSSVGRRHTRSCPVTLPPEIPVVEVKDNRKRKAVGEVEKEDQGETGAKKRKIEEEKCTERGASSATKANYQPTALDPAIAKSSTMQPPAETLVGQQQQQPLPTMQQMMGMPYQIDPTTFMMLGGGGMNMMGGSESWGMPSGWPVSTSMPPGVPSSTNGMPPGVPSSTNGVMVDGHGGELSPAPMKCPLCSFICNDKAIVIRHVMTHAYQ